MKPLQFVEALERHFERPRGKDEADVQSLRKDYIKALAPFSPTVLQSALETITTTRESHWFPTLAECLHFCKKASDAEAFRKQQSAPQAADDPGIDRSGGGIATTPKLTRKIHLACGERAEQFIDVWRIAKANYSLPDQRLSAGLLRAARLLCRGHEPEAAAHLAFSENQGDDDGKSGDPWSPARVAQADRLIQSLPGMQAAREGWIVALHDFCRENARLPNRFESEKIKHEALARRAQREGWTQAGQAVPRIIAAVARAMESKHERLSKLALGQRYDHVAQNR
jgi:hypothetical protein